MKTAPATSEVVTERLSVAAVRLLMLGHSPEEVEQQLRELRNAGFKVAHEVAGNLKDFRERLLHETFDAVLSSYNLSSGTALDAFEDMRRLGVGIPFLLVSETLGEEVAVDCIKHGIHDYVARRRLSRLPVALERALQEKQLREEQTRASEALRGAEGGFRLLFADNPLPMWIYDRETYAFLQVNDAAVEHYGYSRAEFLQMRLTDIRPAEDIPELLKWMAEHPEPAAHTGPWRHRLKDGRLIQVEVSQHRLPFAGHDAALVVVVDTTEKLRAAERLAASENRLRAIVEAEPQCVMLVDPDGALLDINPAGLRIIEADDSEQVIGKPVCSLVSSDQCEQFRTLIGNVCRGEGEVLEFKIQGLKGTKRWLEMHAVPFRGEDGRVVAVLAVTVDVTDRKCAEQALQQSEARAREQFEELDVLYRAAPIGLALFDREFRFLRVNDALAQGNGSAAGNYIGHTIREVMPSLATRIEGVLERVFEKGEVVLNMEIHGEASSAPGVDRDWLASYYPLRGPDGTVLAAGAVMLETTERKRAERALLASEARNRDLVENTTYAVLRATLDGHFLDVNPALIQMLGFAGAAETYSVNLVQDVFRYPEQYPMLLASCRGKGRVSGFEVEWQRQDGAHIAVRLSARLVETAKGLEILEVIAEDVTELRAVEKQLRQAQKFEAVGQLAGGVAHDFNNVVGAILSWAEIGMEEARNGLQPSETSGAANARLFEYFAKIRIQSERAAALTRQLLAYARQQVLQARPVDLNSVVRGLLSFLDKVIGGDIELKIVTAPTVELIRVDPTQIEQVLMNLCLNARDAMPEGGRLLIETEPVQIDEPYCRSYPYAKPGGYVVLSVSDTGTGMDAATRERIFEPFFTTKEPGKGSGLGLATVYGIVKQHEGFIQVYSELGYGTLFRVYLPTLGERLARTGEKMRVPVVASAAQGRETILLAEDHDGIRETARQALADLGYRVLSASDGEEALKICETEVPDLAILDVVMPKLNGPALYRMLAKRFPGLPAIFTTGYTAEHASVDKHNTSGAAILQKPYSPAALGHLVRGALDKAMQVTHASKG
jgi:PAS domain S-box-containing protein